MIMKVSHCHDDNDDNAHLVHHPHEDAVVFVRLQRVPDLMITVIMIMMIMIMSDLDAQGLCAAVQSGEDHVAAPGVVVNSVPAHHGEDVSVRGDITLHVCGH